MSRDVMLRASRAAALGIVVVTMAACSAAGVATSRPSPAAVATNPASPTETAMASHAAVPTVAAPVSTGTFHDIDASATGTVALFHRPDGSFVITFEDFKIDSNAHTNVIFVMNADVMKDADIDKTAFVDLGPLPGTSGMQDFVVPASADAMTFHTIVLWDTEMQHALAAAPLR